MPRYTFLPVALLILVVTGLMLAPHVAIGALDAVVAKVASHDYPRITGIAIGNNPAFKNDEYLMKMARWDVIIVPFYQHWGNAKSEQLDNQIVRKVLRKIRTGNSNILIGKYTNSHDARNRRIGEVQGDITAKINRENWWLRNVQGEKISWSSKYETNVVNATTLVSPDSNGDFYPGWLAKRNSRLFFDGVGEFDIWFTDMAASAPPKSLMGADWNRDGMADNLDSKAVVLHYRKGFAAYWSSIKELQPSVAIIANSDNLSNVVYKNQVHGQTLEAVIGKSWSSERRRGWALMMDDYYESFLNTVPPHIVIFNVWGAATNFQRMRYGLTSCLMNNGYYSYTDEDKRYFDPPWYDEYDLKLGKPLGPPPQSPWSHLVYRREFENAVVLVNSGRLPVTVNIEGGLSRFRGRQDPSHNNGLTANAISLLGKDGIILLKDNRASRAISE